MNSLLWALLSKVFVFVAAGALLGRLSGKNGEKASGVFIGFALYGLIPVYMFLTMWSNSLDWGGSWKVGACALAVVLSGALLAFVWALAGKISFRAHCLPAIFMNSAYLAIPVNTLLWGEQGAAFAIIYNAVVTLANFTLGIWWVSKEKPLSEIAGLPVIYAVSAGAALNVLGADFPAALKGASGVISAVTLPVMLMFVGYRLGSIRAGDIRLVLSGVALRMLGGFISGAAAARLLGLEGPAAGVCVMTSSMPAAVYSYILTEKYRGNAAFAAGAVFAGTIISFFSIGLLGLLYK